jgi:hypothetical protein
MGVDAASTIVWCAPSLARESPNGAVVGARGDRPVAGQADEPLLPPKGHGSPCPHLRTSSFTAFVAFGEITVKGTDGSIVPSAADQSSESHAPSWQYSPPVSKKKPDESIAAPKGHGPADPCGFFPANQAVSGGRRKGP